MQRLNWLLYDARYTAWLAGPVYAAVIVSSFVYTDVLFPDVVPDLYSSPNEMLGQALLLVVAPAILLTYLVVAQRRSVRFAQQLFSNGIIKDPPRLWLQPLSVPGMTAGMGAGFLYGFGLNLLPEWRSSFGAIGLQIQSIATGQLLLWTLVGGVLAIRLITAIRLNAIGKLVPIDLYDTSKLEPFARNGLDDVLAITLMLALSTVQSLDAQFRLGNYANAGLIALPAAAVLLILPMAALHRRLRAERAARVSAMNATISAAPSGGEPESVARLELLMQHRDRLAHAPTWPIDFSIASRLVFYVFIPPLAWVGAALVEFALDRALAGP